MFIFRERERERERGEKHQCVVAPHVPLLGTWPTTQACALIGNRTGDRLLCSLVPLNPLSHTSQGKKFFIQKENIPGRNLELYGKIKNTENGVNRLHIQYLTRAFIMRWQIHLHY